MIKRNTTQEMIEIIQAYQEGKDIEIYARGVNPKWCIINREDISFNFANNTYRVAKEVLPEFPLYAKSIKTNCVVKFMNEYEGYVLDSGSSPYREGNYEINFISCFDKGTWEILSDYEEMEEYFEVIEALGNTYFIKGSLYSKEDLEKMEENNEGYIKTGRSFMLKKL